MKRSDQGASSGNEAPQDGTGFVSDEGTVSALYYTASATPHTLHRLCHILVTWLLADTLLDAHVSHWLACQECCLPSGLCHCRARG
jgi:hypothetical protein